MGWAASGDARATRNSIPELTCAFGAWTGHRPILRRPVISKLLLLLARDGARRKRTWQVFPCESFRPPWAILLYRSGRGASIWAAPREPASWRRLPEFPKD